MYWGRRLRRLGTYQSCRNWFRRLFRRCRRPLGAYLRIGIRTRGAIIFCQYGWLEFSGQADFFFNFQEILAQELDQKLGPELVQNLGPEPGPKIWSKNCTKNLVHVDFV